MLCDMSHITCGNIFRFEVAKLPPQTPRPPTQGLADTNPAYVHGVGVARVRLGLVGSGPSRSTAQARPRQAGSTEACGLLACPAASWGQLGHMLPCKELVAVFFFFF
jgi:hypothetical protein